MPLFHYFTADNRNDPVPDLCLHEDPSAPVIPLLFEGSLSSRETLSSGDEGSLPTYEEEPFPTDDEEPLPMHDEEPRPIQAEDPLPHHEEALLPLQTEEPSSPNDEDYVPFQEAGPSRESGSIYSLVFTPRYPKPTRSFTPPPGGYDIPPLLLDELGDHQPEVLYVNPNFDNSDSDFYHSDSDSDE